MLEYPVCFCDLELDLMTLRYKYELDILKMHLQTDNDNFVLCAASGCSRHCSARTFCWFYLFLISYSIQFSYHLGGTGVSYNDSGLFDY